MTRPHQRAVVHMRFGLEHPDGVLILTGEKGVGKTSLITYLLNELDVQKNCVALIQKPPAKDQDFLPAILASLQIPISEYHPKVMFNTLRDFMQQQVQTNKKVLLVVDDAESLSENCLEFIRLLSTLRLKENGLLQIILVGNNQLDALISERANQEFRQQVAMSYNMHPLQVADTREYVQHRLTVAGWKGDPVIDEDAFKAIHQLTGGIPYEINRYCERLLLLGASQKTHYIDTSDVARLNAAALDKFENFANQPLKLESQQESQFIATEETQQSIPIPPVVEVNEPQTQVKDVDIEKLLYQEPMKQKKSFFDKTTLMTIVAAYVVSLISIVMFNRMSEKEHDVAVSHESVTKQIKSVEPAITNAATALPDESVIEELTQKPQTARVVEPATEDDVMSIDLLAKQPRRPKPEEDKTSETESANVAQDLEKVKDPAEEVPVRHNVIDQPPTDQVMEVNQKVPELELLTPKLFDSIVDEPDVPLNTMEGINLAETLPPEKSEAVPQNKSLPNVSEETYNQEIAQMLSQLGEYRKNKSTPIATFASVELPRKQSIMSNSGDMDLIDIDLNRMVAQFEVAYQLGDMEKIDHMFALQVLSNNISEKKVLMDEYEKLFNITDFRRMRIFDIEWKIGDDTAVGNGAFEAAIREKGSTKKQQYKGSIILHVKKQEKGLEITELYYNYENL